MDLGETLIHIPVEKKGWIEETRLKETWEMLTKTGVNVEFEKFNDVFIEVEEKTAALCERDGVEIPIKQVFLETLKKLKVNAAALRLDELEQAYYRSEIESWRLFPDSVEALEKISQLNLKMAIVSNSRSDWMVRRVVSKLSLTPYFDVITTSAELGLRKPRKEPFLKALKALKVKPEEGVMVGDTYETDILGAKNLGLKAIHIQRNPYTKLNNFKIKPNVAVKSILQAATTVERWVKSGRTTHDG